MVYQPKLRIAGDMDRLPFYAEQPSCILRFGNRAYLFLGIERKVVSLDSSSHVTVVQQLVKLSEENGVLSKDQSNGYIDSLQRWAEEYQDRKLKFTS